MHSDICMRPHSRTHTRAYTQTCKVRMMFIDGVCLNVSNCKRLSIRSLWSALATERQNITVLLDKKSCAHKYVRPHLHRLNKQKHSYYFHTCTCTHTHIYTPVSILFIHGPVAAELGYRFQKNHLHHIQCAAL